MTSVVDGEVKKQKAAINYDLFEMKLDFSSELQSFVKDVVISDFIFSNAATMYLRSLSMCTMAVDDLVFSVTSRMGRNSWQLR
jgi:uncharacterized protein (DUF342 family)